MAEDTEGETDELEEGADPFKEFKKAGAARFSDPFYFSLVASFAVTNWKAIYYLLWPTGEFDAEARLNWIATELYGCWWVWLFKVFVIPIGFACLYVGVIPEVLSKLYQRRHRAIRRLQHKKASIDEEETKIKLKVELLEENLASEKRSIADLNQKIGELQEQAKKDVAAAKSDADAHFLHFAVNHPTMKQAIKALRRNNQSTNPEVHKFLTESGFLEQRDGKWVFTSAGEAFAAKVPPQ